MKQYELVNHLANVQETVSDKKWSKDNNGDSTRDEYRAIPVMVYDYYPFGELMPGRSLDTTGLCATYTSYVEVPHFHRPALVALSGNASAYGSASLNGIGSGGVTASGTSGGLSYTLTGITSYYINLELSFAYLSGTSTITVYSGTNTGSGSTILAGPIGISYTSPAVGMPVTVGSSALSSGGATITVVVTAPLGANRPMFSVDSINYMWLTYTLNKTLYTQCGDPKDKYEFGFNGQMKMNEIAGVGNHNTALFWEYDTRVGRRWNRDPRVKDWESPYASFGNNPVLFPDPLGLEIKNGLKSARDEADTKLKSATATLDKLKKGDKGYKRALKDKNSAEKAFDRINERYNRAQRKLKAVEDRDPVFYDKANHLKDEGGTDVDIYVFDTPDESMQRITDEHVYGETDAVNGGEIQDVDGVKPNYNRVKSAMGPNTATIKISDQSLVKTLAHELGHAVYQVMHMREYLKWLDDNPKERNGRGHGKNDPSGAAASDEEEKFP